MKKTCVFTHGGITLDLSRIKSLHIDTWSPNKRSHILRIELDSHYEYIKNPDNEEYEKVLIRDYIEHAYADYATAETYRNEWQGYWEDYLSGRI